MKIKGEIAEKALYLVNILENAGYEAYFVGGAVRDYLMGKEPHDFDIATSATPDVIQKIFSDQNFTFLEVGKQFGIVILYDPQTNTNFEIATLRTEDEYSDGRHPDSVKYTSDIYQDLARRDFTMNAIAYRPKLKKYIDPFRGKEDIKGKLIRFVGDPSKRIKEDRFRILRSFRFHAQLGFKLFPRDKYYICHWQIFHGKNMLHGVSTERVREEFSKILLSPFAAETLNEMAQTGVLFIICPELREIYREPHFSEWHQEIWEQEIWENEPVPTIWGHTLLVVQEGTKILGEIPLEHKLPFMLACLFHDIGKKRAQKFKKIKI
jgi:tRNA nucleotidyltransferase/poly(A) polymerase